MMPYVRHINSQSHILLTWCEKRGKKRKTVTSTLSCVCIVCSVSIFTLFSSWSRRRSPTNWSDLILSTAQTHTRIQNAHNNCRRLYRRFDVGNVVVITFYLLRSRRTILRISESHWSAVAVCRSSFACQYIQFRDNTHSLVQFILNKNSTSCFTRINNIRDSALCFRELSTSYRKPISFATEDERWRVW